MLQQIPLAAPDQQLATLIAAHPSEYPSSLSSQLLADREEVLYFAPNVRGDLLKRVDLLAPRAPIWDGDNRVASLIL